MFAVPLWDDRRASCRNQPAARRDLTVQAAPTTEESPSQARVNWLSET
jgi:hypothetical protein